jgi:hypothetical protein
MLNLLPTLSIFLLSVPPAVSWRLNPRDWLAGKQHVLADDTSAADYELPATIPGNHPFSFCNQSRPTDLYNISRIDFNPQPLYLLVAVHVLSRSSANKMSIVITGSV